MRIERILAPNPGPFTGPGTNTWLVSSDGEAIVIDPGPIIESHLAAIASAAADLRVRAVLVTHTHPDHAPAANSIATEFAVPAVGAAAGPGFSPDREIADGETVEFGALEAVCVATPGHTPDSVCFRVRDALFTGDHIMGGSTVIVEDMAAYLASLRRLEGTGVGVIHPGHGPVIDAPDEVIAEYIAHRLEREVQIVDAIERGAGTVGAIVEDVYAEVDSGLHAAASISVMSHLAKLQSEGRVIVEHDPTWDSAVRFA